jgi:hypothetical protein
MSGAVRCRACLGIAVAVTLVSRVEFRNVGRSKRDATKTGYRSFGLVLQPLNGSEWLLCQRSVHEVDADTPPGIVECANLNAIAVLPIAVALRVIPSLQILKRVHVETSRAA